VLPEKCESPKGKADRKIIIEKAGAKGPAVRHHGDDGQNGPREAPRHGIHESARAPEKNQHGHAHDNLFRQSQAENGTEGA